MKETTAGARGFGLVEVLIVLTLLAVIMAGAVPGIHRISREWALWGGAQILETSLFWARLHAIAVNDSLTLKIDEDGRSFSWLDPEGTPYGQSIRYLPPGIRIASGPRSPLRFFPHGNAAPAGTFVVEGEVGRYRIIVSILGRIRIQRD